MKFREVYYFIRRVSFSRKIKLSGRVVDLSIELLELA